MPHVRGTLALPVAAESLRTARIRFRVEDVSRLDDRARVLGELMLDGISASQVSGDRLVFEVAIAEPEERARLALRVHLDVDRDGAVSPGDYVTTEHVPVRPGGDAVEVLVQVRRVGGGS
jgi:hypothetical protein